MIEKPKTPIEGQGLILKPPPPFQAMPMGGGRPFKKMWGRASTMDQGQTSQCVWFTWAAFVMSEPRRRTVDLSLAADMYYEMQRNDGIPGTEPDYFGTTLEAGHLVFKRRGFVLPTPVVATTVPQILECLRARGPVAMGTEWRFGMTRPNNRGRVSISGENLGGHAWLAIGANTADELVYGLNSHGSRYGVAGVFTITFSDLSALLRAGGYGLSAIQPD